MDKARWQAQYAPDVPAEADVHAYPSVRHLVESAVARYGERPAFTSLGRTLSYAEVGRLSRDVAGYLQHDLGLGRGDRLAIMLPNLLAYPLVLFGAFQAGLVVVNVNPQYTARELERQLKDSGARALVVLENFAHVAQQAVGPCGLEAVIVCTLGDLLGPSRGRLTNFVVRHVRHLVPDWSIPGARHFEDLLAARRGEMLQPVELGPQDLAFLQYTSGTTGAPKGAMLTHGNVIANVRQNNQWSGRQVVEAQEVVVTPLPLYHVLALMVNLLAYFNFGGHDLLVVDPRDIPALIKLLKRSRFSGITGVNTLYRALLDAPGFAAVDLSHLKSAVAGGAAVQPEVAQRWQAATGVAIVEGYGLTETGVLACQRLDSRQWSPDVGLPYPSTEISIRDEAGAELPPGAIGEVCARGPQVSPGYWNRPAETAQAFTADGWFRTGDLGRMDDTGRLTLVDRKKDMIVVSGFKVYPTEVEEVVKALPGVEDAAAIGVPDAQSGEAVRLLVVRRDPALDAETVLAHCRANLTGYKRPRELAFRASLPRSPIGKVLRRSLREEQPGGTTA